MSETDLPLASTPDDPQLQVLLRRRKRAATDSLFLGVLSFLPVFGPVAAVLGLITGISCLAKGPTGRRFAIAGVILSLGGILLTTVLTVTILLPDLNFSREMAKRAKCGKNLNTLGKAVLAYQENNKDLYPADLNSLIKENLLSPDALHCPSAKDKGRTCNYFYAPPQANAPGTTVIACDLAGNHPDVRNVLHASGSVDSVRGEKGFAELMAKPENAEFAAKLRQAEGGTAK